MFSAKEFEQTLDDLNTEWIEPFQITKHGREVVLEALRLAAASGWRGIDSAPKDGTVVFLYWPTMSITQYPAVGAHHGDEYGWDWHQWRDYGEVFPTLWQPLPAPPQES